MTTNLLSVIEQQHKALEMLQGKLTGNVNGADEHCFIISMKNQVSFAQMVRVSEAIAAGQRGLEQTRVEAKRLFPEPKCLTCRCWSIDKDSNCDYCGAPYVEPSHPQATEPAPAKVTDLGRYAFEPAPSTAGERTQVVEDLLMYAGDNGYSHIDYADTMRHAAALLSAPALPAAAMPVGELTDEQCRDIWHKCCAEWLGAGNNPYLSYARAILASARSQPTPDADDLYWKLHSLSASMEGSGLIDEHDNPEAYGTLLDAMNALRASSQPVREPLTDWQIDQIYDTYDEYGPTWIHDFARAIEKQHGITKKGEQ